MGNLRGGIFPLEESILDRIILYCERLCCALYDV